MQRQLSLQPLSHFYVVGINYKKTDASTRGLFSVNDTIYSHLRKCDLDIESSEIFILSTCNRTEVYGFAQNPAVLVEALCSVTQGTAEVFLQTAYELHGEEAIRHFLKVSCGLDSQILGDFEITSQVKKTAKKSREAGLLGAFTERLINRALQTSKQVKNNTRLSSGTASVSFAAIKYLKNIPNLQKKQILLFGVGKIGQITCKNVISYLETRNITLVNRTEKTAKDFAIAHGIRHAPLSELNEHLKESEVILVATNAPTPTINEEVVNMGDKVILDLSVPKNVSDEVKNLSRVTVVDVDELSMVQDKTLNIRKKEIPKAEEIIEKNTTAFLEWYQMRKNALVLKGMKEKIEEIQLRSIGNYKKEEGKEGIEDEALASYMTQKIINVFGGKLKEKEEHTDEYYQVLGALFDLPVTKT